MTLPHAQKMHSLLCTLAALLILGFGVNSHAQDNSEGRYRPEGREIGRAAAQQFGERLFEVRTYEAEVTVDEFAAATIFYPLTLSFDAPMGGLVFMPGYRGTQSTYDWWGPALASLGYAVMIVDTNSPEDSFDARKNALVAGVDFLKSLNSNADSPLQGKLDGERMAIMGHSLGGGASVAAALELGDQIKAVIPLALYCCQLGGSFSADYSGLATPTLVIASAVDEVAPPAGHARAVFDAVGDGSNNVYMEFSEGDHMFVANGGPDLSTIGHFALAFLKLHLDDKAAMREFLSTPAADYADNFSNYEANL